MDSYLSQCYVKCKQSRRGFEHVSPCPFSTTITITPRAVLCSYQKRFSFFLKVSLSETCPSFLMRIFACLSFEISMQLFFFPFCFLVIFALLMIVLSVVFLVADFCLPLHFYVVFKSLYRCIDNIFNAGQSSPSFFS